MHLRTRIALTSWVVGLALGCMGAWAADDSTPTFQYDNQHTGRTENAGPAKGDLLWKYRTNGSVFGSPVIAADGTVYVASTDGRLYAFAPAGTVKWYYQALESIYGTPAIAPDGTVLFGDLAGRYYSIKPDGSENWVYQVTSGNDRRILTSPVVDGDGQSYIGSWNDNLLAVKATGDLRWKANVDNSNSDCMPSSAPVLDNEGNVYVAVSADNDLLVKKYSPTSSTAKWDYTDSIQASFNRILSSPAIDSAKGVLYVGACRMTDGVLYGISTSTGARKLKRNMPKGIVASPAIGKDGTLYVGCLDGKLYALDPTSGAEKWAFQSGAPYILGSASLDKNGIVYFGDSDGVLYALSPAGEKIWQYATNNNITSAPVIAADGTMYVTSSDSTLYALGQPAAVRDWLRMNP